MDTLEFVESVKREIAADIREMPDARDALIKILDGEANTSAHPMTNVLDMLADIARDRSQDDDDRWFQISRCIAECAVRVEHKTQEPT